jgi:DNA-binding response OmpR family regulator
MRKVFIIDDEKDFRKKYKKLFRAEGYKVLVAPDFVEVANILMREKSNIGLIVLDINLPEVDGRDISEIIDEYAPELPILVSSVIPIRDQKLRIRKAFAYHNKLDGEEALLKKVRSYLGDPKECL